MPATRLRPAARSSRSVTGATVRAVLLLAALAAALFASPSAAFAQDEPADAPAAAAEEPAPAAAAPAAGTQSTTFLSMMVNNSGIFGLILLLMSVAMVYIIAKNYTDTRRGELLPDDFVDEFEEHLDAKEYKAALELAQNDDSMIARVLEAGMLRLRGGADQSAAAMQEVGEAETMALEHKLSYLALIGSVAPMIGLMGTVYGMIQSFSTIANSETAPKPKELAEGISQALFTTIEGLAVAVPAMIAYLILRNRMAETVLEVGTEAESLMRRISAPSTAKKPAAAAPAKAE